MKLFYNRKQKRLSKTTLLKPSIYNDIEELPIRLWFKINKTNDYTLLIRTGRATDEECEQSWLQIMNQYIEQVGINDNYKQLIEAKKNLALALVEYHITGDAHNLNFVKIHEEEIRY